MTRFFLVRHGEKEKTIGDPGLTELGREQAYLTSLAMPVDLNMIFVSPLKRTMETAEIINQKFQLELETDNRLRERFNWGDQGDENFEQFIDRWNRSNWEREYKSEGEDSSIQAGIRFEAALREYQHRFGDGCYLVVSHGGIINDFLLNNFDETILNNINPDFLLKRSGAIGECSITEVELIDSEFRLIKIGDTDHLENEF